MGWFNSTNAMISRSGVVIAFPFLEIVPVLYRWRIDGFETLLHCGDVAGQGRALPLIGTQGTFRCPKVTNDIYRLGH
jgi:hypothetical protein